jgi:protein-disulfide isomerase
MTRMLPVVGLILAAIGLGLAGQDQPALAIFSGMGALVAITVGLIMRHPLLGSAFASGSGAAIGLYLTIQHQAALAGGESFCNISETLNCDVVNTSFWSDVLGVPTALYGAAFYLALTVISLRGWQSRDQGNQASQVLLLAMIPANLASLGLIGVSIELGAFCLFCVSLYLVAALVAGASVMAVRPQGFKPKDAFRASELTVAILVGGLALGAGTWALSGQQSTAAAAVKGQDPDEADWTALFEIPMGTVNPSSRAPSWGKPDAPILIVEWADYECPHCARTAKEIKKVLAKHPQAQLQHRHYPLSSECNPVMTEPMHQDACGAARAAICAQGQGRFWELSDQMFKNQTHLSPDDITFMVKRLQLDQEAFDECLTSADTASRLAEDIEDANTAGLSSTPTLYVKGLHPDGWIRITLGTEALDLLLDAAKRGVEFPDRPAAKPPSF